MQQLIWLYVLGTQDETGKCKEEKKMPALVYVCG